MTRTKRNLTSIELAMVRRDYEEADLSLPRLGMVVFLPDMRAVARDGRGYYWHQDEALAARARHAVRGLCRNRR